MGEAGRARTWVLAFVAAAVLGLGGLIGVGCLIDAGCPFGQKEQTSTDGRTLFLANCAACHGREGAGGEGPSLVQGEVAGLEASELAAKISRGKPLAGMPAFKRILNDEQIRAVAAYVVALRGDASAEPTP